VSEHASLNLLSINTVTTAATEMLHDKSPVESL